jgi:hypothetical protein
MKILMARLKKAQTLAVSSIPESALIELSQFVEFLQFKTQLEPAETPSFNPVDFP